MADNKRSGKSKLNVKGVSNETINERKYFKESSRYYRTI